MQIRYGLRKYGFFQMMIAFQKKKIIKNKHLSVWVIFFRLLIFILPLKFSRNAISNWVFGGWVVSFSIENIKVCIH